MFGATTVVKNSNKEKSVHRGYGTAFDGKGEWSFCHNYARNVVIFGVATSSSSQVYNLKTKFLVVGKGDTFGITGSFDSAEKNLVLILVKQSQNFI